MAIKTSTLQEDRVLLNTDWKGYEKILEAIGDAHVRVTYDCGSLEIMSPGWMHGAVTELICDLLKAYMDEADITFEVGGVQTFKRRDKDKGMEPDGCYWVSNAAAVLGIDVWDPLVHPPPDMAVETEVTHGFINRLPIYAALGIPEVWWYRRGHIQVLRLNEGTYERVDKSPTLPGLSPSLIAEHLRLRKELLSSQIVRRFRKAVRVSRGSRR